MRHEAVLYRGGTGFFKYNEGNWWNVCFGNDSQTEFREKVGLIKV